MVTSGYAGHTKSVTTGTYSRSMSELTDTEREILAIEGQWWAFAGAKEAAIRERLGMSTTRFHQLLSRLIDSERALAVDPILVKSLRRRRFARQYPSRGANLYTDA